MKELLKTVTKCICVVPCYRSAALTQPFNAEEETNDNSGALALKREDLVAQTHLL
jgi:hypothetical protein